MPQRRVADWTAVLTIPALVGIMDSSSYIFILSQVSEITFYSFIIFVKIAIIALKPINLKQKNRFLNFTVVTFFAVIASSLANESQITAAIRPIAVCISVLLTVYLIREKIIDYAKGYAISGFIICLIFIFSVQTGMIIQTGERYHFLAESHPNLGGELVSATLIMSSLTLGPRLFLILGASSLYCTFLLQSRTSTLAILIVLLCYGIAYLRGKFGVRRTVLLSLVVVWITAAFTAALAAIQSEAANQAFDFIYNTVFLVEDQYRGGYSGVSGRDEHWWEAIRVAMDHPFIGAGPDFMERLGVLQPHNWTLYAISQFGMLGWVLVVIFGYAAFGAVRNDPVRAMVLIPLFVPWLLNDRFLNFNAYPFALYIIVFAGFSLPPKKRRSSAPNRPTSPKHAVALAARYRQVAR
ncbi:MAG: hypothetical protein RL268_1624 [Pseudomonadota bacterium]